jgi:hypothetical protein
VLLGQFVELLQREDEKFGFGGGDGVVVVRSAIEEGQAAEEVAAAEGGDVAGAAGAERGKDFDRTAADQVDRIARFAARIDRFPGGIGPFLQPGFEVGQGFILAVFEEFHFSEFERDFRFGQGAFFFAEQAVFDPFDGVVQFGKNAHGFRVFGDAGLFEKFAQVAAFGPVFVEIGKQQQGLTLGQRIADPAQHVGGGDVDGLDALHVENDELAGFQIGIELTEQLLGRAEKEAALQFKNDRLIALLFEGCGFPIRGGASLTTSGSRRTCDGQLSRRSARAGKE